jgi:formate hydrogenlyase subunit 6/NADH:ubiquinone oxidoreductase subunit I
MKKPGVLLPLLIKHLLKKPFTVLYPFEEWKLPTRYRGMIVHDNEACIGCGLCSRVCPAAAIEMVEDPEKRLLGKDRVRKQKPLFFLDRCMRCAQCEESCPKDAIHLEGGVGLVSSIRTTMRVFSSPSDKSPDEGNPAQNTEKNKKMETTQ